LEPARIVWIAAPDRTDLAPLLKALAALGFGATPCAPGESLQHAASLRVLPADAFAGPDEMHGEYLADPRPTLVLTQSEDQELKVLQFLTEQDELAPFTMRPELLAARLTRLSLRAAQAQRTAPPQTDALTGLPNRERFETALAQALARLKAGEHQALVYLDLDHFEQINERHARLGGDLVLVQLAMLLGSELAPTDVVARLSADKFACLLSRYDRATLQADAKRLLQRIAEHEFMIDAHAADGAAAPHLNISASAGLAFLSPGVPMAELWRQLDVAVFDAKTKGRNRLAQYAEPSGITPLGSTHEEQAQLQHLINVTKVVSERVDQLLKPVGPGAGEAAFRDNYQDALTQLHNRRYFDLRLEREFGSAQVIALQTIVKHQTLAINFPLRLRWNFHRLMLGQSMASTPTSSPAASPPR
jgi:diguanylate cyclase (GGDEF)-like protein